MPVIRSVAIGGAAAAVLAAGIAIAPLQAASASVPAESPGSAARADTPSDVIFIGDSVTAGFGYFGASENAKNISGSVNKPFENSWYLGDNSLKDCSPADKGTPIDQCSNNNINGAPWNAGPWQPGANSPTVSYSYKIAASQNPDGAATVENWAVTGSTPADWDPQGGVFGFQLKSIKNQTVVMTLGANPILADFLKIRVSGFNSVNGVCADKSEYFSWKGWWANPTSTVVDCARNQWTKHKQAEHLSNVYRQLLANNNKVMVLGYYANCPWSFGNWQPNGNVAKGPASGNSCASETQKVDAPGKPVVSQLDHAIGVGDAINSMIASTVAEVQNKQPNGKDLQFVLPDQKAWLKHQATDSDSWIFKNDTWIHPSDAGHTQLAKTVTNGMCLDMGRWCGSTPSWTKTSVRAKLPKKKAHQKVKGSAPAFGVKAKSVHDLPAYTMQDQTIYWKASKSSQCKVKLNQVIAKKQAGNCTLTAKAIKSASLRTMKAKVTFRVY